MRDERVMGLGILRDPVCTHARSLALSMLLKLSLCWWGAAVSFGNFAPLSKHRIGQLSALRRLIPGGSQRNGQHVE